MMIYMYKYDSSMHGISGSHYDDINLSEMSAWGLGFKHVSQPKIVTGIFQPEIFLCIRRVFYSFTSLFSCFIYFIRKKHNFSPKFCPPNSLIFLL